MGGGPVGVRLRTAAPCDYDPIAAVVDAWWGREVLPILPRLFLDLFWSSSLVADDAGGRLAGFLVGVLSPSDPHEAYIHFVGVAPQARGLGLGRALYERFLGLAAADGRTVVRALTSPVNTGSIAFHRATGFAVTGPVAGHNGPGTSYVLFDRRLEPGDPRR